MNGPRTNGADSDENAGDARFLGRAREMRGLLDALELARSQRGRLVLIGGEPGIGKSRLADEFARVARSGGTPTLWSKCWDGTGAPPYWPWVQTMRSYLRSVDPAVARAQLGPTAADIVAMLPELGTLYPDLPPPSPDSESARFRLFDSVTGFLRRAAEDRALVIILDDLQAADTPSILLLRFLASQIRDMRLLVVGTVRDIQLTPEHPLTSAMAELAREPNTELMTLGGLGQEVVPQFIEAASGHAPDDQLTVALWQETRGNPLFMGEAVRLLAAQGRLEAGASGRSLRLSIPAGIRDVISRRVERLGGATVDVLTYAAALGPEFDLDALAHVSDHPVEEALELLADATSAGLLVPASGGSGRYRFSHDLVRETVYAELTPAERIRLHRRIAERLESLYAKVVETRLAELAHHFVEASTGGDVDKALDYARRAGDHAARSLAYEEAARLYRMALGVIDQHRTAEAKTRVEILLALGSVETRGGDLQSARATFLESADIARREGMARQLARAALGLGGRSPWERPGTETRLVPLLQDALAQLGDDAPELRARVLARLACAWRSSPEHRAERDALSQQALALARRLDDPETLCYTLVGRYFATWGPDDPDQRLEIAHESIRVAESLGDMEQLVNAQTMLFSSFTETGRIVEARRQGEDLRRLVAELRQPGRAWLGEIMQDALALMEGDFAAAEAHLGNDMRQRPRPSLARDDVSSARMQLFLLRREQDRATEVEGIVRASAAELPWYPLHRAALALLLATTGREDEGRTVFAELADGEFRAIYPDNNTLMGLCLAAEAAARLGERVAAGVLYARLAPYEGRHAVALAEGSLGVVDRYLGLLADTRGRLDEAENHLANAVRGNEAMGARPWAAHARSDLAAVLRNRQADGDLERAASLERAALATARQLGMVALVRRLSPDGRADSSAVRPVASGAHTGRFQREGEFWTIVYGIDTFRLRDSKGLHYLARLLSQPSREVLALDLIRQLSPAPAAGRSAPDRTLTASGGAVEHVLDARAKAEYRERLRDLQGELAEAEDWNDPERADRARREIDFLGAELSRAVGIAGRDRQVPSDAERARVSVTRALRSAIARVAPHSPALHEHLESTVQTGTYCVYRPDPRVPLDWEL